MPAAFSVIPPNPFAWAVNWAWGLPLIVLTVIIHVAGLSFVSEKILLLTRVGTVRSHPKTMFVAVTGAATLAATCLHGIEAGIWAEAYRLLSALPNFRSAMLYSLNAITSYGHATVDLSDHWQLMGALEAVNGWLLFGLTTAFLFGVIEKVWSLDNKRELP